MAKEKHTVLEKNTKDLTFYYEILGVSTILVALLAFARLGLVGYYIMMAFRIVFGDWYFAFLLALFLFGIRALVKHQPLNLKNMRAVGIILIMISLLTVSHFPMHQYIKEFGSNYLKMTIDLYLDYFKNYQEGMIVGGGLLGMGFFYLFFILFSSAGAITIAIFILLVGISFSFDKTIKESLLSVRNFLKKIFGIFTKVGHTLKYDIKVKNSHTKEITIDKESYPLEKPKKILKNKKLNLDLLDEVSRKNYLMVEEKHACGLKKVLANVLNNMNTFYNDITYMTSSHVTSFTINTIAEINLDKLYLKLKAILTERFLITKDQESPKIKIEVDNIDINPPCMRSVFNLQKDYLNNKILPIGINTGNELLEINLHNVNNLLIIEDNIMLIERLMLTMMLAISLKLIKAPYEIIIYDLNNSFPDFVDKTFCHPEILPDISVLKKNLDERLNMINQKNCNNIDEYIQKNPDVLDNKFLFISGFDKIIQDKRLLEELLYLLQLGPKVGYYFFVQIQGEEVLSTILDSSFDARLIGKNSSLMGEKYVGISTDRYLYDDELFFQYKDELYRFSPALISDNEKEKFLKL